MIFYVFKFILNFLLNICSFIMKFIIRKDNNIILIGGWMGETFSDNSRFLYQYLHHYSDKKVVWVTRNNEILKELSEKGYHVYKMHSMKSYYYHFKAGIHIVCNVPFKTKEHKGDILGELSLYSRRIQLWHGNPLKGIGSISDSNTHVEDVNFSRRISNCLKASRIYRHLINVGGGWDDCTFLATSNLAGNVFSKAFGIDNKNICITAYPRNCECLEYLSNELNVLEQIEGKRTILYVPTFREKNNVIMHPLTDKAFEKFIRDNNFLWIEKRHLVDSKKRESNINSIVDELVLPSTFDLNVLVPKVDILITDYSSICFDFIFFNKPVQYYVPDFEFYEEEERGFSLGFEDYTAGWVSKSISDLSDNIRFQSISIPVNKIQNVKSEIYKEEDAKYSDIVKKLEL